MPISADRFRRGRVNLANRMMAGICNTGFLVSGIFHLLILLIPVSMNIAQRFDVKDVELFVMDEIQPVQKTPEIKQRIKEPQKKIEKPVRQEKVIEPVVWTESPEATALPKPVEESVQMKVGMVRGKGVPNEPMAVPVQKPSGPRDTEFDSDSGPKFLHREMPQYPMIARRLGKEGRVILRLTIDEKGNLINIKVIENADYGFTEAAVEAVKKSTFLPAMIDGRPVTTRAVLPIKFTLRRD